MIRPHRRPPTPSRRATVGALVALVVVVGLVASACSQEATLPDEAGPPTTAPLEVPMVTIPPGFEASDTSEVVLAPFEAAPTVVPAAIEVVGGQARLTGVVTGPDGPVPGATVQLERFVDGEVGNLRVPTGPDGRFALTTLQGGRYRVRAWAAPTLTATRSTVAFIPASGEVVDLALAVERHAAPTLVAGIEAGRFQVGDALTLRALLTRQVVDGDGIVVDQPVGATEVSVDAPGLAVVAPSTAPGRTDAAGRVSWRIECAREGGHRITLRATPAPLPATGTSAPAPATPVELVVDAPACARATQEPRPDLPVGGRLQVPAAGPVPAGTYVTTDQGCATSYELWASGAWEAERRQGAGAALVLAGPARALRPATGTTGCDYQRVA
jgi:phage baseplate assembly protein gpV